MTRELASVQAIIVGEPGLALVSDFGGAFAIVGVDHNDRGALGQPSRAHLLMRPPLEVSDAKPYSCQAAQFTQTYASRLTVVVVSAVAVFVHAIVAIMIIAAAFRPVLMLVSCGLRRTRHIRLGPQGPRRFMT